VVQRLQTRHTGPGILLKAVTRHNPGLGITGTNTPMENLGGEVFSRVLTKTRILDWCRDSEVARPCIHDSLEKDSPNRRPVDVDFEPAPRRFPSSLHLAPGGVAAISS
jgi:hypothetical protein